VSEPDISTLAKRLAEQNNVDWRVLKGSGPSGKVVERDVLDYLARVMAGEEALDPTPEPLPEGMQAWPDQDLRSFQEGLGESASDMNAFRSDLASSVEELHDDSAREPQQDGAFGAVDHLSQAGAPAAEDPSFDDDVEGIRAAGAAHAAEEAMGAAGASIDEDIFLFDDDEEPEAGQGAGWGAAATHDEDLGFEAPAAFASDTDRASDEAVDAAAEPDDLLVVDGDDEPDVLPAVPGDVAGYQAGEDLDAGWQAPAEAAASMEDEPSWVGDEIRIGRDAFGLEDAEDHQADDDLWVADAGASADTTHDVNAIDVAGSVPSGAGEAGDVDLWDEGDVAAEDAVAADAAVGPGGVFDTPSAEPAATDAPYASFGGEDDAFEDVPGREHGWADEVPATAQAGLDAPEVTEPAQPTVDGGLPTGGAASFGAVTDVANALPLARTTTLLRRHIDVSALAAAQLAVGQELGDDEPLGASAFLLRAVAKAARDVAFEGGQVALAVIGEGVRLRRVDDAASRSFGSLVAELREPGVDEDEIGLVAADLSGLDLDEAVLDVSAPVVTLGRILYDNQRGAYRSTLSLAGELPLDLGARLLARVADLLDAPVRLVL